MKARNKVAVEEEDRGRETTCAQLAQLAQVVEAEASQPTISSAKDSSFSRKTLRSRTEVGKTKVWNFKYMGTMSYLRSYLQAWASGGGTRGISRPWILGIFFLNVGLS